MKARAEIKVKTYEAEYGFLVDVVDTVDRRNDIRLWEAWLYRENMGTKMFMFGLQRSDVPTIRDFLNIVESNLPEYYPDYDEQFSQYDDVDRSYEDDYDYDEDDDDECVCCPVCGSTDVEMA